MSQPPLSARIQGLERELGVRLFERGPGAPVSLTQAGNALLPVAQEIVKRVQSAEGTVRRIRRGQIGELRVAAEPGVDAAWFGSGVTRFRATYPDVRIAVCEMDAQGQLAELEDGGIDVAVIRHVGELSDLTVTVLHTVELGVACTPDDVIADGIAVGCSDVEEGRAILVPGGLTSACRDRMLSWCRMLGFEPTGEYGASGPLMLLESLGALLDGPLAALTPASAVEPGRPLAHLTWRPARESPLMLSTSAAVADTHESVTARNFVAVLTDAPFARTTRA